MDKQKVIVGYWDGEPIWRWETPEERLMRNGIPVDTANLYLLLNNHQPWNQN